MNPIEKATTSEREVVRTFTWRTSLDNYEPARDSCTGTATVYAADATRAETITLLDPTESLKDPARSIYLVDNGSTVTVWYVAGWNRNAPELHLQPFPTNPDGRTRPDNGRVIDYNPWALGPRRAYHLKVIS